MIKLTKEQTVKVVETIRDAYNATLGTPNYLKYLMQEEAYIEKTDPFTGKTKGHWHFVGDYVPSYVKNNEDVIIYKKIRDTEWLYYGDERYMLSDEVKELFK